MHGAFQEFPTVLPCPCPVKVPTIRAGLLRRTQSDWRQLAESAMAAQFGAEAQRASQQQLERMLHSFELMCGMEEEHEARQVGPGLTNDPDQAESQLHYRLGLTASGAGNPGLLAVQGVASTLFQ